MIRTYAVIILPHFFLQIYKKVLDSIQELWYYIVKVVKGNKRATNYIRRLLNENEAEQKAYCKRAE